VKGCRVNGKVLCSAQKRWQGRQCIHPVDYIKSVQHIDRLYIHIHIKHMCIYIYIYIYTYICIDLKCERTICKSREAKREEIKKERRRRRRRREPYTARMDGWMDGNSCPDERSVRNMRSEREYICIRAYIRIYCAHAEKRKEMAIMLDL